MIWSKLECTMKWQTQFFYYIGDLSNADYENDWRLREVPKKRKQLKFIEIIEKP